MAKKVLVLEDESSIRGFIVINLTRAGYEVIESETGEEALEKLRDTRVAPLDIMLPGIDGFEVCRRIRATNTRIGIIMLTARSQEMDKVTGLMTGADDYVTKPFSQVEYSIMKMFMENPGKALSREEILDMVWGRDYFGELKIVDVNIRRLRLKIEDNAQNPTYINTVWGYGYKWGF